MEAVIDFMKKEDEIKRIKTPWPTKNAMEQVYKMKLWGDNKTDFYSQVPTNSTKRHNSCFMLKNSSRLYRKIDKWCQPFLNFKELG